MFRDTQKELARLEAELLAEEPEALSEENPTQETKKIPHYRAYNTDITDEDLEEYAEEVRRTGGSGLSGFLTVLLCLLTAGLVALVVLFLREEGIL